LQPNGPNPFCFAEAGSLSSIFQPAGFQKIDEKTVTLPWTWPGTPEEVWEQARAVAVPFHPMLERVPADLWPEINREIYAAISRYVRGENIEFGVTVVLASGTK
jgi:hypothetical protein